MVFSLYTIMVKSNPYDTHIMWNGWWLKNKKKSKTVLAAGGCLAYTDADETCSYTGPLQY